MRDIHAAVIPYSRRSLQLSAMGNVRLLSFLCCLLGLAASSHFRGGVIQWRPVNATHFDGRVSQNIIHYL